MPGATVKVIIFIATMTMKRGWICALFNDAVINFTV